MSKPIKCVPAQPVRHPDGRLRGLALSEEDWRWLQFKPGERVIVEFVTEYQERRIALGHEHNKIDIASGEVVIDAGQRLVRCYGIERNDLRYRLFVRRPAR